MKYVRFAAVALLGLYSTGDAFAQTKLDFVSVEPGRINFGFFSAGCISLNIGLQDVRWVTVGSVWQKRTSSSAPWVNVPGTTSTDEVCGYTPTEPGEYRIVATLRRDGVEGLYTASNTLIVRGEESEEEEVAEETTEENKTTSVEAVSWGQLKNIQRE